MNELLKTIVSGLVVLDYKMIAAEMEHLIEMEVRAAEERGTPPEVVYGMLTCGTLQIWLERSGIRAPLTAITHLMQSYRGHLLRQYGRCPKCGVQLQQDELQMDFPTCLYCFPWEKTKLVQV